jgi:hypothetical protein
MAPSAASASGSSNTMAATAARSREPSGATIPSPKRSTISSNTAVPGCCSSWTITSASTTTAPRAARAADTVDFPDPMPPVSPINFMAGT